MTPRTIGPLRVQPVGLGCMNLDHGYGPPVSAEQGERLLLGALDNGCDFFDTASLYGGGDNESRLGQVLRAQRSRFSLASKCGMGMVALDGRRQRVIDGSPEALRRDCENSLRRLRTDVIDLYYLHRWDRRVPIEDSVGALARLVTQGHIRAIGLSEVSAETLRRAHAVHPIAALQSEYSLWTRNPEIAVLAACRELDIALVAFSPLGRGFFGSPIDVAALDAGDIRRSMPRFEAAAWAANRRLWPTYQALAKEAGCSPAQLALAWLLHQAPQVLPIPGTTQLAHWCEDMGAADVRLSPALLARLGALVNQQTVVGERYNPQSSSEVDTEHF